ncbi:hypothetical protein DFJ73DRAFT_577785 [Zopfochytrium polystomum]|nr:hypothetical protein DFJ73DRAFT_577785 [Zopfochytrium polystomum]
MVAYSVAKNATLLIEIDDMSAATSAICKFREKPQIVVVAKSLKSAFMIGSLGVRDTSVAVGHGFGAQTIWDVGTLSNVKNFWEAHPAEMIALNPWLGIASRKRGRRLISQPLIIKQAETDGSLIDIVLSGVTDLSALNVKMGIKQAGRSPLWDYLKLDVQPTVSIPTTVVNTTAISLDTAASAAASIPFAAKWAISCLTPAIIFFIAVGSKSLNRKSGRLHNDRNAKHGEETRRTDEQARNIVAEASSRVIASAASPLFQPTHDDQDEFAKEIDAIPVAQRPTQTIAIFLELIAIAAWAMFCVGAGNSDGNPGALDATGYTTCVYIFAVSGFLSAGVSMLCLKGKPNTGLLSLAVVLLGICCFTGGFVTHALLRYGMNGSAAKLALTGAATFGAARALSALFSGVQYSYISLELEHLLVGLSVVGTAGWILVAIGMGRVQVNTISGETVQTIGQLGAVTAGSLACSISFAASWFNTPILMAAAMFFSVASIFFCGGLITSTATACFSGTGCSSQQIVIFCGGLVLLISATVSFGMRASNRDTEETKKREFTVQFRDVASLSQPRGLSVSQEQFDDHPVFVNIGASTFTPFTHHKQKWLVWKAFACSSIVGWVLFLGGFGSSVTVSNESIACGTVFAVFAPAAVTCTWLSLVNDSRSIAIVAHIMWTISLTASGKVLFESISLAVSGLSTSTLFTVIGLLIFVVTTALSSSYVLNMFDLADEDQASVHSTFYATGAFAAIYTVGLGLWLSKLDNVDSTVAGILACVFGVFACGIQGCLILAYSGKDRTALKFVALVLFCFAYIQMGASIILSGVNAYSCGTASCAKITQAGLILSIIGGLGFVTCSTVTACSVLRFGYFDTISDRAVVEKAPVIPDPESLSENDSSIDEGELKPPAPRPLDIFTLMQAWPRQRAWLKICSAILLWAAGLLDASLGSMRLDKDWRMDQLGVAIVAVSGILAALISISWICRGDVSAFIFGQFLLLITVSMSGYTTVWAAADNLLSFTGGVLAESIVCGLCSATILVLLLAWNKPQVAKFSGPLTTFDICHFFNGLAWLAVSATLVLTVVKFGLASVAQTMTDIVFIAVNAATTAVYLAYKIDQHRSIFYALLLLTILSIFTGGGLLYGAVRSIAKPESGLSGLYLGISIINLSLAFVSLTSNSVCVLYQAIQWKEIEVFPFMSFQQDAVPDRSLMWLRSPNSRLLLIALKLALLFAFMGWVVFVFGLGFTPNTSLAPPLIIHHLFSVSTPIAVAGSTLYLYLQWVVFAVFGFAAAILSFATAGAAAASIVLRASSTQFMPLLALAGLSVSVAALITAYTIILHRQRPLLPNDEQTASIFSSILIGMSLGLLLIVVSIGLDQGADAATYMEISFPGLFAFLVLLLEKLRPGRPFHQLSKAAAVFLTSVSLIATGGSFQFVGGALGGGAPGPYIRLAGNFFVALGNASYLVLVFYYRLRNTGEAGESEEALNEDSDLTIVTDRDLSSATVLSTDTEQVDSSQDVFKSAETVATDVNQETRSATVDSSKDDSSSV